MDGEGSMAFNKIVYEMTVDLDLSEFHDGYKERIEALIVSEIEEEVVQSKEKRPKKPAAKSMMKTLKATAE